MILPNHSRNVEAKTTDTVFSVQKNGAMIAPERVTVKGVGVLTKGLKAEFAPNTQFLAVAGPAEAAERCQHASSPQHLHAVGGFAVDPVPGHTIPR